MSATGRSRSRVICTTRASNLEEYIGSKVDEERLKIMWVSTLFTEYRTLLNILYGATVETVDIEVVESEEESDTWYARKIYLGVRKAVQGKDWETSNEEVNEVIENAKYAWETLDYDYYIRAAEKANKILSPRDGWTNIRVYRVVTGKLDITREDAERIRGLGEKIADMLAKLGGRAEAELRKLIFTGYRKDIVDTIEGLSGEEKEFLKQLLSKPYERASLLFAYKRLGNFRRLQHKILSTIFWRNSFAYLTRSYYIPVINQYL